MKKISILINLLMILFVPVYGQLSIDQCQQMARQNYPLIAQHDLIEKTKEYNLSNAGKSYLPQLSLSAKASYQSAVTEIPIKMPGMKGSDKDQYSIALDLKQTIWDGGAISSQKDVLKYSASAEAKDLEVSLYAVRDRVNQMYFGILLLDAKLEQNKLLEEELGRSVKIITSYIDNGIANRVDLDAVKVELLNAKQNESQLQANRKAYVDMLSVLIGESVTTKLTKPVADDSFLHASVNRPELESIEAKNSVLEAKRKIIDAANLPKVGLFATGGYGRPSLNMLENKFDTYYIAGVNLTWNFGNLYTKKNDKKLIEMQQSSLAVQKETFLFNTKLETTQEYTDIQKNRELLKHDDEIISLRNNIKKAAEVKVANGTMTVIDLMREVTSEDLAKQNKIQHEVELLLAIYNLKFTTNN